MHNALENLQETAEIICQTDAWLGTDSIILPNVRIGTGAVVGAGAVVLKDVPDFTVVVGIPAKVIKKIHTSN